MGCQRDACRVPGCRRDGHRVRCMGCPSAVHEIPKEFARDVNGIPKICPLGGYGIPNGCPWDADGMPGGSIRHTRKKSSFEIYCLYSGLFGAITLGIPMGCPLGAHGMPM